MIPLRYDIDLYENDTDSLTIRWKNPDGTPVPNLDTAEIFLDVKKTFDGDPILSLMGEHDRETGEVTFLFYEGDTQTLLLGGDGNKTKLSKVVLLYDIEFVFDEAASFDRTTLLRGRLTVYREITKVF